MPGKQLQRGGGLAIADETELSEEYKAQVSICNVWYLNHP